MRKFNLINIRNDRQFRAFTGLPESVFNRLLPVFVQSLKLAQQVRDRKSHTPRRRRPGGGRKGALPTPELKLFFSNLRDCLKTNVLNSNSFSVK